MQNTKIFTSEVTAPRVSTDASLMRSVNGGAAPSLNLAPFARYLKAQRQHTLVPPRARKTLISFGANKGSSLKRDLHEKTKGGKFANGRVQKFIGLPDRSKRADLIAAFACSISLITAESFIHTYTIVGHAN